MKIVTYNIHKGMDSNNMFTLNKIIKYLKDIDADIICIQEVLYEQFAILKHNLKLDGVFAANINNPTLMYGVATLSKYEILKNEHVFLKSKKEQRGFLYTNVFSEKYCVDVINTHLGLDKDERKEQISEIMDYINLLKKSKIICGDFNEENVFLNTFNDSAIYTNYQSIATFEKSNARIDYILLDKSLEIDKYYVDKINLSDHYPVIVDIK
ncbi:endonuclease/exonuclease/phosphatase family protein [Romboutsia sp. 13368]|uniref:endonuclease/exonuclease/phosphatase family protein n=1 Tax=Romboutsia sp. 13368 TaxID=2708053 RepID=UPI0025DC12C7|nr:endonuclease/exonuclease/phosphatase family protein [Romboutsia sp. 13368]